MKEFSERQKKGFVIFVFLIFLAFCGVVSWYIGRPMLRFVREPEAFRLWVDSHGLLGKIAFVGMMVLQVMIAFIPGEPLELGAGYAFGAVWGTLLCLIGIFIGSLLVFSFVRKFGVKLVEVFFPVERIQQLRFLKNTKRFHRITFLIFLIPGTPKDLLCYVMGLTDIRLSAFLLISTLARLPSVVTSTVAGNALGVQRYLVAGITLVVTLILSLAGMKLYDWILKRQAQKRQESASKGEDNHA